MVSTMENRYLKVSVKSSGAELTSIKSVEEGYEYLWQGDEKYWIKQSPVLFPIIGSLDGGKYKYENKIYELEHHGFAKESEFELVEKQNDKLHYRLESNDSTLEKYPFRFHLDICYILDGKELKTRYSVENTDTKTMWFSIGAHPGFNCPFNEEEAISDYYIEFEQAESLDRSFVKDNILEDYTECFLDNESVYNLSEDTFNRKAIILKGYKSKSIALKRRNNPISITVKFDGFPYLGIWSAEGGAPFICIEPWYGVNSRKEGIVDISCKEGMLSLEPGKVFECEYSIVVVP